MFRLRLSFSNNCSSPLDVSDRYSNLKAAWDSLMEAATWPPPKLPGCCHDGPGTVEEGGAEEARQEK
jgi:hypothetical protein